MEIVTGLQEPQELAVDATHVYWTTAGGAAQRSPIEGGSVETLAEDQESPRAIAVDAEYVFWANEGSGRVSANAEYAPQGQELLLCEGWACASLERVYFSRKLKKGISARSIRMATGPPPWRRISLSPAPSGCSAIT